MAIPLKQSTASQEIPLGYFVDVLDGNTEEGGLTIANTDIKLWKQGATTLANKNSGGATSISSSGIYYAVLDATDTDTLGGLIVFVHVAGALAIRVECVVLPAVVYDSLIGGTDKLQVHVDEMTAGIITAAVIATGAVDADAIATDAVTEIQSGLATAAALTTIDDLLDTEIAAILADTNELQTDWVNGGRLDLLIDAIKAKTDNLPADPADDSDIDAQLAAIAAYLDTEVAAILAAVDTEVAAILADTNELQVDWVNGGRLDLLIDLILADTGELQTDWVNGGRLDLILDARASQASVDALENLSAAEVNAQVVDALATDTYAEPGAVPAATASLKDKIGWLFMLARNKRTTTATADNVRNDADSSTVASSVLSDDGSTFTRGEYS